MTPDAKHRVPIRKGPFIAYNGGVRPESSIDVVVVHDAEGSDAWNTAVWGASGQRSASWHCTADQDEVVVSLPDHYVAWAAPGANRNGLQLEICGFARWSRKMWFTHQSTLKRAAWQTARWCRKHGIPARWLTDAQLKNGAEGLTTHVQVNRVYRGSDHTDPGPNFPYGYFLWLVKRRVRWLEKENL